MTSHTLLALGLLLVFIGAAALYVDYWRRKTQRTEKELKQVQAELERKLRELERRRVQERMKHNERG